MLTYDMIIHLNIALSEAGLHYKLRYLNGMQAGIEPLGHCCCEGTEDEFAEFVTSALLKEGIKAEIDCGQFKVTVC